MHKFKNLSFNDKLFYMVVNISLTIMLLAVLYPCIFVISASFSSGSAVQAGKVLLLPVDFSLEGYKTVLNTPMIWTGFRNSLIYTVLGTLISLVMTLTAAYCLSRKDVPGRNAIMLLYTFTMFFGGGMIPGYMLVRELGFINTIWAIIIPGAVSTYNLIVAKTFIQSSIPGELLEAAVMDGCSDIKYYLKIVIPLSKSIIAVLVLYYGVGKWNEYFGPMIYLNDRNKFPLTIFLQEILLMDKIDASTITNPELQMKQAQIAGVIKYALIIVSMIPVMIIYPFIQKHFVKGVMIGSIKG